MINYAATPGILLRKELTADDILNTICHYYGYSRLQLSKPGNKRVHVMAKQLAAYFLKKYTNLTLLQIGTFFLKYNKSVCDHTTIIDRIQTVNELLDAKESVMTENFKVVESLIIESNAKVGDVTETGMINNQLVYMNPKKKKNITLKKEPKEEPPPKIIRERGVYRNMTHDERLEKYLNL